MRQKSHKSLELKQAAIKTYLSGNYTVEELSKSFSVSIATFFRWLAKYRKNENLEDLKNLHGGGPEKKINPYWKSRILKLILKPADQYGFSDGLWSTSRIVQLINERFNLNTSKVTVWRMLKESDFFYKSPEINYHEGDVKQLDEWLKKEFPEILKRVNKYKGILYFMDESNIKLTSVKGKTWAPKGVRPTIKVSGKRGSIAAISAINSYGNLLFNVYDSTITSEEIETFIQYMLDHHKRRHLFILMDNARVHKSERIKMLQEKNKRLHIEYLPPYWPKYNPDEYVWNYLKNQEMKVYSAKDSSELMKLVANALSKIASNSRTLKAIFMRCPLYHYI